MPVTLINVFSVPKGKEDEFVKWWQDVKANITKQEGFISGKFHKTIKSESRYNYINRIEVVPIHWTEISGVILSLRKQLSRSVGIWHFYFPFTPPYKGVVDFHRF